MATSFQPEKPHSPAPRSRGNASIVWLAVVSALVVVMLFAVAAPRLFWDGTTDWVVSLGAGVVTLVVILAYGFLRRPTEPIASPEAPGGSG
jgi:protein-S-isoprenylcysteine O-methyltransferase Ste14